MKKNITTTIAVIALLFSSMQIIAQDSFNLNYKYAKGNTYAYRLNVNSETVQNVMGQEQIINSLIKGKIKSEVSDATSSNIIIIGAFDSLYTKTSTPGGDQETNGEGVVGKKVKTIFDQTGKRIKRIEIDPIESSQSSNMTSYLFPVHQLAAKQVKAGDTWNIVSSDTSRQGEDGKRITKTTTEYKVVGMEKYNGSDCLKISEVSNSKVEGGMTQGGMEIVFDGTGKTTGFLYFSIDKGVIAGSVDKIEMNLTATVAEQNISIPITIKIDSNLQLL